jgi:hypothetical protein
MQTMTACRMKQTLGKIEPCPGSRCPFWSDDSCAFREVELDERPDLAGFLLEIRNKLETLRAQEDEDAARQLFYERLNAGRCD